MQPEDPRALADRILWLLKHPDESKLMGRAGARIAESKFTAKVMMDQLVQVYDNLLN